MLGIGKELSVFVSAFFTGNLIYLVYCAVRVLRRIVKHTLFWISVEDLLFWMGTGIYIFVEMFRTCAGSIRWYFVLGVLLGGIATWRAVGKIQKVIAKRNETR